MVEHGYIESDVVIVETQKNIKAYEQEVKKLADVKPFPKDVSLVCEHIPGTQRIEGGLCKDGVFYTDPEIHALKHMAAMSSDGKVSGGLLNALLIARKALDIDIASSRITSL